ncbi:MAG: acylphosphatase [Lachnospiraceae bacterium]|nr:acylphosphatase [Lachnospiraceae bacterium]
MTGTDTRHGTIGVDLPEAEGIVRYRLVFRGQVQGVGFRYTMRLEAQALSITGWVHNHYDGSVVAEVQGENAAIRMLVYRVQESRFIRIDDIEVEPIAPDKRESTFSVK